MNPYIYCYQNPVKYIDPNGKQVLVVGIELPSNKAIQNNGRTQNLDAPGGYGHVFFYMANKNGIITDSFSFGPAKNMTTVGNFVGVDGTTNYAVTVNSRLYPFSLSEKQYGAIQKSIKDYNDNIPDYRPSDNTTCAAEAIGIIQGSKTISIGDGRSNVKKTVPVLGQIELEDMITPLGVYNGFEKMGLESRTLDPKKDGLVDKNYKIKIGIQDPIMKGKKNK